MESTTYSSENRNGTAQSGTNKFNEINSTMMDIYDTQARLFLSFCNNFFSAIPGMNKNSWDSAMNFPGTFPGNETFKSLFTSVKPNDHFIDLLKNQTEEMCRQTGEFNTNWIGVLQNRLQDMQSNRMELNGKLQKTLDEHWKTTRDIVNSMVESYHKQADFSNESTRKFLEEINKQFDLVTKQTSKLWTDVLKTSPSKPETSGNNHEQEQSKKQNKTYAHSGKQHHN